MKSFDYIVVGGGTAGSVLAARLSQTPGVRVLLLEAGAAHPCDAIADPAAWFTLAGTSVDWAFQTAPQPGTDDAIHPWPRGKVLGGSSAINGMMHVRGDRSSYDAWETAGATGWNYTSLLPFFKRSERAAGGDPEYRGSNGPMQVGPGPANDPLWEACFEAAAQAGHRGNPDNNAGSAEGVSWHESTVVDGRRQSAADAYLTPAARSPNLSIVGHAHVQRLLIKGAACLGVRYTLGGQTDTAFAEREVILTAGTIGTPHLLLLSGVGSGQHLRSVGIDTLAELPGVGENLHDHPKSQVAYTAVRPVRARPDARKPVVLTRTGASATPDLQMIFVDSPIHPRFAPGPEDGYSVIFSAMTPASRGSVRLASADPRRAPVIDPNYLADERDLECMVTGLRRAREIGAAVALKPVRDVELFPGPQAHTDDELRKYLRRSISTYFHPVGTCKIGSDAMSVVDPDLKVHGISNLRIADASVMPSIVSGNTNAAVLAIAERAAALLTEPSAGYRSIDCRSWW
jgi:choline dehydrogenase